MLLLFDACLNIWCKSNNIEEEEEEEEEDCFFCERKSETVGDIDLILAPFCSPPW